MSLALGGAQCAVEMLSIIFRTLRVRRLFGVAVCVVTIAIQHRRCLMSGRRQTSRRNEACPTGLTPW